MGFCTVEIILKCVLRRQVLSAGLAYYIFEHFGICFGAWSVYAVHREEKRTFASLSSETVKCFFLVKSRIANLMSSCVQEINISLHVPAPIQVADLTVLVYLLINQLALLTLRSNHQNSELTSTHRQWGEATRRRNRSLTHSAATFTLAARR